MALPKIIIGLVWVTLVAAGDSETVEVPSTGIGNGPNWNTIRNEGKQQPVAPANQTETSKDLPFDAGLTRNANVHSSALFRKQPPVAPANQTETPKDLTADGKQPPVAMVTQTDMPSVLSADGKQPPVYVVYQTEMPNDLTADGNQSQHGDAPLSYAAEASETNHTTNHTHRHHKHGRLHTKRTLQSNQTTVETLHCPVTYEGGCWNWKNKTLSMEYTDRQYTVEECGQKCRNVSDCGGFFLGKTSRHCLLVKSGCRNDYNNFYLYYQMSDCVNMTDEKCTIRPATVEACAGCQTGVTWWPCNTDPPLCPCAMQVAKEAAATTTTTTTVPMMDPMAALNTTLPPMMDPTANADLATTTTTTAKPLSGKMERRVDDSWGNFFVWTLNVTETDEKAGPQQYFCLKRYGSFVSWAVPNWAGVAKYGPPNQPCTAFHTKSFGLGADDPQSLLDNAICTGDSWCLVGNKIAEESEGHGAAVMSDDATTAIRFNKSAVNPMAVRTYINTRASGLPTPTDDEAWKCIRQLVLPVQVPADVAPEIPLKLTAREERCADVMLGWID